MQRQTLATLSILGPFVATVGGERPLALPKKARALLAFLACRHPASVERDDLAALLWNDRPSAEARHSLRQCLAVLRKALGPARESIETESDTVRLLPGGILHVDLVDFAAREASSSIDELLAGEALFRGELLQGLAVRSEPFEAWLELERRSLAERRLSLLERLHGLQRSANDMAAAVATARRLTELDPYREDLHRLLLQSLADNGQRGLAMVEHARTERRLRDDLGLAPDHQTRRLAERIRTGNPTTAPLVPRDVNPAPALPTAISMAHGVPVLRLIPFAALSPGSALQAFAAGFAGELATALHRERWPVRIVIAGRQGSGSRAPADYELTGQIRLEQDRLRAAVQLVHCGSGHIGWAHTFEMRATSLLSAIGALLEPLRGRLGAALRAVEEQRAGYRETEPGVRELYLRAAALSRKGMVGNARALELLRTLLAVTPYAPAYALTARCLHVQRLMGWIHPRDPSLKHAERSAFRALECDDQDPEVLWMAGLAIANVDGNASEGRALVARSLAINPSNASAWIGSAFVHAHSGDPQTALAHFERAQSVNPDDASQHVQWHAAAMAHFIAGHYEEADLATDRALLQDPYYPGSLRMKVATSAILDRAEDAQDHARRLLRVNPEAGIAGMRDYWGPWVRYTPDAIAAWLAAWQRVRMPD